MPERLYLDTSAVLRAVIESGTTPEVEQRIRDADLLVTSRLSLVEASRAFSRLRLAGRASEALLSDAEREAATVWARCVVWELTSEICDTASHLAPSLPLRTLDALHLATFVSARRRIQGLEMLSVDERLLAAIGRA